MLAGSGPAPTSDADFHEGLPTVDEEEVEQIIERRVLAGDAQYVSRRLQDLQTLGVGEVLCWARWGTLTHDQAVVTMRRLSEEVMPALRGVSPGG